MPQHSDGEAFGGRVGCVGGGSERSDPGFIGEGTCRSEGHSSVGQDHRMSVFHREGGTPSHRGRGGRVGCSFVEKQMEAEVEEGRARFRRFEEELEVQVVLVPTKSEVQRLQALVAQSWFTILWAEGPGLWRYGSLIAFKVASVPGARVVLSRACRADDNIPMCTRASALSTRRFISSSTL